MSSHAETVKWCAEPSNYRIDAGAQDARSKTGMKAAREENLRRALEVFQKCGFVKVKNAVGVDALQEIRSKLAELLAAAPTTPLLANLRPSLSLDDESPTEAVLAWPIVIWLRSLVGRVARPWQGDSGRMMLDMPFVMPFNSSDVTRSPLLMPLVTKLLGGADLGVAIEQAAHIMAGPRTGQQQPHTDAAHFSAARGASHDAAALASTASSADVDAKAALAALMPKMRSGEATYALNLQLVLQKVEMADGPTVLCPATHSETFCEAYLGRVCKRGADDDKNPADAVSAIAEYADKSGLCADGSSRVYGTNQPGDALLYDSRMIHWGGANSRQPGSPRHVISFTYSHGWYTEIGRDLSPLALSEAVKWRYLSGTSQRQGVVGAGAIEEAKLRSIHDGMREMRDKADRVQLARAVVWWLFFGYVLFTYGGRWRENRRVRREESKAKAEARAAKGAAGKVKGRVKQEKRA